MKRPVGFVNANHSSIVFSIAEQIHTDYFSHVFYAYSPGRYLVGTFTTPVRSVLLRDVGMEL